MIRFLRACFSFARRMPFWPRPEWTPEDARTLAAFFNTMTGRKLLFLLRNEIIVQNERAAFAATPRECGWAMGFRGLYAWFEALSSAADAQQQSPVDTEGDVDLEERFAP